MCVGGGVEIDEDKNGARKDCVCSVRMKNLSNVKLFVFLLEQKLHDCTFRPHGPKAATNTCADFSRIFELHQ